MPATVSQVSDMLLTVKSREVQRALFAESAGDRKAAQRHFLAAAHLELVLAHDYEEAGERDLAMRSQISAASCLWAGGEAERGRQTLEKLATEHPAQAAAITEVVADLTRDHPLGADKK
jgi:hypothetical protein